MEKWHEGELHDSYRSPNTIGEIVSKIMFWAGHEVFTGERRGSYSVFVDKSMGKISEELGVDGRVTRTWECVE